MPRDPRVSEDEGRRILEKLEDYVLPMLFRLGGTYQWMQLRCHDCYALDGVGQVLQRLAYMHGGLAELLVYGEPEKDGTQTTFDWQEAA